LTSAIAISSEPEPPANLRGVPRTSLFVAATIIVDDQVDPVRVRNMSPGGALLEGAVLPKPGNSFELVRAHLHVSARSMWVCGNQCGVSFGEAVDVAEWMTPNAPTQQQRIDALFHQARCNVETARKDRYFTGDHEAGFAGDPVQTAVQLLDAMEEVLVLDPHMQMNHSDQMRALKKVLKLLRSPAIPASIS